MSARQERLAELRRTIPEVNVAQAFRLRQAGAVLIDVREPDETVQGSPRGAHRIVGVLQAVETIKVLLGIGEPLVGRLLRYEALESRFSAFACQVGGGRGVQ